ncbi:MAG TPA: fibronectin type III domain-containing protein [Candidatus Thermoplasmatota archaeon]|nr:fibronectin type III domain-containing protein [Candidatus Thermoplasmatota archaeon]
MSAPSEGRERRPRRAAAIGLALTLWLLPLALGASGPASGLFVNILGPSEGSWTANASTNLWGTVGALGNSTQLLDSPAELGAGSLRNTTLETGAVALKVPQRESYGYFQDFTGLVGVSRIDGHWPAKISDTAWAVTSSSSAGASPPALVHTGTLNEKVFWTVVLPGPLVEGSLAFKYGCEANGNLTVAVSTSGFGPNELTLVSTGSRAQTAFNTSLTPTFAGASSLFVRASARATNASASACSIDDFEFFAEFVPSTANPTFTFFDDFTLGLNAAWDLTDGRWSVSGPTDVRGTSDPPGLLHIGSQRTSAFINLAFAAPIRNATISFDYKTNYYGRVAAYLGGDGSSEGQILADDGSYMTPTTFSMDVTSILLGGHSLRLRIDGSATLSTWNESGVDDVRIEVETDGAFVEGYEGGYTGPVLDAAVQVTLDAVTWSTSAPAGAWIGFYVRASADGLAYTGFQPVAGNGTSPLSSPYRYFQLRANMTAPAASAPVRLEWLSIRYHGIAELSWSAGGGPWNSLPLQSPWSVQAPLSGGANTFTVRARDTTGALAERRVNVSRDVFSPGPPGAPQGPAITGAVSATWTWAAAPDVGLGVDHYIVDAGTTPGGSELVAGQPIDGTAYTIGVLPEVATVYVRVSAVDGAGLVGPYSAVSEPTLVDRVPPGGFAFRGPGPYINASEVLFNWSEPNEVGSWVAYYIVLVGTAAGSANVADTTSLDTSFAVSGLESGRRYYATAMAVDAAGNIGPLVTSGGTLVDLDAPGPPGALSNPAEWTNEASFGWTWSAATDPLTGIWGYRVRIGSQQGLDDVLTAEVVERAFSLVTGMDGRTYYVAVAALDLAGNEGPSVRGGPVRVDRSPPPAVALPAFGAFVSQPGLTVEWPVPVDLPTPGASGIERYEVTIVEGGSPRTLSRASNYTQLSLLDNVVYEVHVVAVDNAGNRGADAVVAFKTDMTGPSAPGGVELEGATAGGQMTVRWQVAQDASSGVLEYRVKVGTRAGEDDVVAAQVATGTSVTFPAQTGTGYFVTVWTVDRAGNEGPPSEAGPFSVQSPLAISVTSATGLLFVLAAAGLATGAVALAVRVVSRRRAKARKRAP